MFRNYKLVLFLILLLALALRLTGINWDSSQHLHPDERYLTMVANDIRWPSSLLQYLDPTSSPLSPYNHLPYTNYIYGTLPLFLTKAVADLLGLGDYGHLNLVGRVLSALFDTGSVFLVYLLVQLISGRQRTALMASFLSAVTVTQIQHAHFFGMESALTFFSLMVIFWLVRFLRGGLFIHFLYANIALGAAVACKISASFLLGPVGLTLLLFFMTCLLKQEISLMKISLIFNEANRRIVLKLAFFALAGLIAALISFRLLNPYIFANASWLSWSLNYHFLQAFRFQLAGMSGETLYPPAYQWLLATPLISPLKNLTLWALGPLLGLSAWLGVLFFIWQAWQNRRLESFVLVSWILLLFLYAGSRFVCSIRYLLPIVPFLVIAASLWLSELWEKRKFSHPILAWLGRIWLGLVLTTTLLYAFAYLHIYLAPTTRVAASEWIYQDIPPHSTLANEEWDDPLPLHLSGLSRPFNFVEVKAYQPDDEVKLQNLYQVLTEADYVILSSARARGSVGRLPDLFPLMSQYYNLLEGGELGYQLAEEFTSYPSLFGIMLDDRSAEETFWVYDHPRVAIYKKAYNLSWPEFRQRFNLPALNSR